MSDLEQLFQLRNEGMKRGLSTDDLNKYITWKKRYQELDIPFPSTNDWNSIERTYDMFRMLQLENEIEELEEQQQEEEEDV
ncbi:MAG: hypothetical protein VKL60_00415 [Sphaerospermopsis sp.]|nr:hypothetical protein [Sphaerospermopsis sp.]